MNILTFFKKVDFSDVLLLLGCICLGYSLFFYYSHAILLVMIGVLAINMGILRDIIRDKAVKG